MDEASLKRAFHALEKAYQEGDVETFLAGHDLESEGFRVFLPDFGRPLDRTILPTFLRFAMALPGAGWILPREIRCEIHGEVGIVTYLHPTGDHELGRGTRVFRWEGERWLCIHTHLSAAPAVDPPVSSDEGE